jgi:hypothetical protein
VFGNVPRVEGSGSGQTDRACVSFRGSTFASTSSFRRPVTCRQNEKPDGQDRANGCSGRFRPRGRHGLGGADALSRCLAEASPAVAHPSTRRRCTLPDDGAPDGAATIRRDYLWSGTGVPRRHSRKRSSSAPLPGPNSRRQYLAWQWVVREQDSLVRTQISPGGAHPGTAAGWSKCASLQLRLRDRHAETGASSPRANAHDRTLLVHARACAGLLWLPNRRTTIQLRDRL